MSGNLTLLFGLSIALMIAFGIPFLMMILTLRKRTEAWTSLGRRRQRAYQEQGGLS